MKKLLFILIISICLTSRVYASTSSAYEYVLMDQTTGRVLKSKNANSPKLIASITKIMSCIIAIESGKLDEIIKVDDTINSSYGSGIYIEVGEEMSLRDMLYGLMLRSGNDAAIMIATFVAGSEEEFTNLMNNKALEIGMKNTTFTNSSGLDNGNIGNYSTAYDMALLTRYAMKNEEYRKIVSTKKYVVKTNYKTYSWTNKNKLLKYDYITGGKTGYTISAKRTLVSSASIDNMDLIVVTIRDSDDWNTHLELYNYAKDNYTAYKVLSKNKFKVDNIMYKDNLYINNDVYIPLKVDESSSLVSKIKLEKLDKYKSGDRVGSIDIYLDDDILYSEDIYIESNNYKKDNFFISLWKKIFK